VNGEGKFTQEAQEFAGMFVFDANQPIIEKLKDLKVLLYEEEYTHSYPHCWRCHQPIIFRATSQWFMNLDHHNLRKRAQQAVAEVKWNPAWGEDKMKHLLITRPDYCLSRQRIWGTPIPVFYCQECGKELVDLTVIDRIIERIRKEGTEFWFREDTTYLLPSGINCSQCGSDKFTPEVDIVDVWFESGISWAAVLEENPDLTFPADLYLEATDQHRGWFQSSLLPAIAVRGKSPYRQVITHGLILDEEGKKMSKSRGNVINPLEIIEKYGADILRLWFFSVDFTSDTCISEKVIKSIIETYRKIRNTARYLLGNLGDFTPDEDMVPFAELAEIDRFALMKLQELVKKVTTAYENYEFHQVYHYLKNYCILDLSAFYLDILKDRLYILEKTSPSRRSAQTALYQIISVLVRFIAPLLPFTAEEIWHHLPKKKNDPWSIHLTNWPSFQPELFDRDLKEKWRKLLEVREKGLKALELARGEKKIGQSLEAEVVLSTADSNQFHFLTKNKKNLEEILIVSRVSVCLKKEGVLTIEVKKASGKKCHRCWMYQESVGQDKEYSDICARCVEILKNIT
jgi:isoleucyl-tRNA synthetase